MKKLLLVVFSSMILCNFAYSAQVQTPEQELASFFAQLEEEAENNGGIVEIRDGNQVKQISEQDFENNSLKYKQVAPSMFIRRNEDRYIDTNFKPVSSINVVYVKVVARTEKGNFLYGRRSPQRR